MAQLFDIAAPGVQSGLDALINGTGSANNAPEGLFSSLMSLVGGNTDPKLSDLVQLGSPSQTGEAWLNLQLGDASLSLSAEALTTPITAQSLLAMAPDLVKGLDLDGLTQQGLNSLGANIGETIQAALDAKPGQQIPANIQNTLLSLQETTQSQNRLPTQLSSVTEPLPQTATELAAAAKQTTTGATAAISNLIEDNPQIAILAKTLLGQNQTGNQPALGQVGAQDSLAAQLQRQMGGNENGQSQQNPTAQSNTQAAAQNATPANAPLGFAAAMSQLQIVQTRPVVTTPDPLMVAQTLGQSTAQAEQATLFQPVKAAYQSPQVNLPHMAISIARNFQAGKNNFQIRLDPAELGRVNIQLSVDDSGAVTAKMLVERPETLQLLQQDARALERALSQAGLDTERGNLEFFQKDNPFSGNPFANPDGKDDDQNGQNSDNLPDVAIAAYQGSVSPEGISLWI